MATKKMKSRSVPLGLELRAERWLALAAGSERVGKDGNKANQMHHNRCADDDLEVLGKLHDPSGKQLTDDVHPFFRSS